MTEAEWLTSEDPQAMLAILRPYHVVQFGAEFSVSDRKLRLFADACRHSFYHGHLEREGHWSGWESDGHMESRLRDGRLAADVAARGWASEMSVAERPRRAAVLRCVFGNPWRPAELPKLLRVVDRPVTVPIGIYCDKSVEEHCPWLTPEVIALARRAYDARDWSSLPQLADALEEAGCPADEACPYCKDADFTTNDLGGAMMGGKEPYASRAKAFWNKRCACKGTRRVPNPFLAHLRGPGPHCRGCWVLDLILGKS